MDTEKLAIDGGAKTRTQAWPTVGKRFGEEELQELREALDQNTLFYMHGGKTKAFCAKLCQTTGAKFALACSSGTASIHAALKACGVGPGDEVITTPITDAGTVVGIIYEGRTEKMNEYKQQFAVDTPLRTLAQAFEGADVFVGVSAADLVTPEMLKRMASNPIVFAMANPDPEIAYDLAIQSRPDVIIATGRSDFPNQVNNVLGFPFIFRGALDVRASAITDEMKIAAARALAELAKEDVPEAVLKAYRLKSLKFGREYLIPKPFDHRVLLWEAPAVAAAAMANFVPRRCSRPFQWSGRAEPSFTPRATQACIAFLDRSLTLKDDSSAA